MSTLDQTTAELLIALRDKNAALMEQNNILRVELNGQESENDAVESVLSDLRMKNARLRERNVEMADLLDQTPHQRYMRNLCNSDCPACAWEKLKEAK